MKYTIKSFHKNFPNDNVCLEYMFNKRFGKDYTCPKCGKTGFYRVAKRKCYDCAWCGYQIHPLAGTIFHKSSTSLKDWFFAIFLMSQSRNGVSAKEIQRHLGVTYKTAWRMQKQIRKLMAQGKSPLNGTVEADETYIGGRRRGKRGRGSEGKTPVFGMAQRKGKVRAKVVGNVRANTITPLMRRHVEIGSDLMTDDFSIYDSMQSHGYKHGVIKHTKDYYVDGDIHINTVEGFWSQLKRSIHGTYHKVSPKYLQLYVDEFAYRYNRRTSGKHLFQHLLEEVVEHSDQGC